MNRPYLVNFSAIVSDEQLSIRASITDSETPTTSNDKQALSAPIQSIGLFSKEVYRVKIIALNQQNETVFKREYDSDNYGRFEIKLAFDQSGNKLTKLLLYESSKLQGIDLYLGSYIPLFINDPKKIVISDFDKTLVDTKYSTAKEVYYSLSRPLEYFPKVEASIQLLEKSITDGFQPFILSASPHFYENAIRDWFYQNKIYVSNIFLKDYRDFISLFDGKMTTKDLKRQGFYKLNQLIDILLMTKIPNELILIGDGFESDPFIYMTLKKMLDPHTDPWKVWNSIKNHNIFSLTSKQDSHFLTKFYLLNELSKKREQCKTQIYIRASHENIGKLREYEFLDPKLTQMNKSIEYYLNK